LNDLIEKEHDSAEPNLEDDEVLENYSSDYGDEEEPIVGDFGEQNESEQEDDGISDYGEEEEKESNKGTQNPLFMMTSGIGQHLQTANVQPLPFAPYNSKLIVNPKFGEPMPMKGHWTGEEDHILHEAVNLNGGKNWKKISESLPGRSDVQCLHRW